MPKKVVCNSFVKRQTAESQYSYFNGTWEQLEEIVEQSLANGKQGYKPGVLLVPIDTTAVYSAIVELMPGTPMNSVYQARRDGEDRYVNTFARGEKAPAATAVVVLYSHDVLEKEAETDAEYEIVSLNASPTADEVPMDPVTMMRNFLERPGGTKGDFTAEQFAKSIQFWSQHALVLPPDSAKIFLAG